MAIKKNQVLTIDLSKETNVNYSANKKTALNLTGVENLTGIDITTDGKNLYFKKGETTIATISKFTGLKYSKFNSDTKYTTDLISGMVEYTGTLSIKKKTVTGSNYNDTLSYADYTIDPTDLAALTNKTGLIIKSGKGNDVITGSKYNDTITGGAGTNTINISVKSANKFGNDTVVLTKGENLRLMLDVDKNDLKYSGNNYLARHLWVKNSGDDAIIEVYTNFYDSDESGTVSPKGELVGSITIKNYFKKDVLTNSGSFTLVDKNGEQIADLRADRLWKAVYMDSKSGHYNKQSYTGGWSNDSVDARDFKLYKNGKKTTTDSSKGTEITTETEGFEKIKGVTMKLGGSVDYNEGYGSIYADTIVGGANNDYIVGGKGNDTITGGKGNNWIDYTIGDGNDTVNLTKGENIYLNIYDTSANPLSVNRLDFQYANKNKDMIIYVLDEEGKKTGSIKLKNFGKKDYTGSNGSVNLYTKIGTNDVYLNLKTGEYSVGTKNYDKTDLYTTVTSKNFTGTWLSDYIDASSAYLTKTIGKGKKKQTVEKAETDKGLTLKGGAGDDVIYGSKYSDKLYGGADKDKIYGGTGNDTIYGDAGDDELYGEDGNDTIRGGAGDDKIYGGKGNDKLYGDKGNNEFIFYTNDGVDTIYSGKGTDSIRFADLSDQAILKFEQVKNSKGKLTNDLKIYYGLSKESYVIIKDYFKKVKGKYTTSVKNIYLGNSGTPISIAQAIYDSTDPDKFKDVFFNRTDSSSAQTVNSSEVDLTKVKYVATGSGDDNISLDGATNALYIDAGAGNNTISAKNNNKSNQIYTGDGNQTITTGDGADKIEVGNGLHNINAGKGKDTITTGNNTSSEEKGIISTASGEDTITVGDGGYKIDTEGRFNNITAGNGENEITIAGTNAVVNKIEVGDGNNTISIGANSDNAYGNNIKTGSGDNTITLGNGSTMDAEHYWNVIETGDGHNVITTGYGNVKITTGDSTSEDNKGSEITIGNDTDKTRGYFNKGSEITTGSGDDTIKIQGSSVSDVKINAGAGNNTITLDGNSTNNSEITAGAGDDTIEFKGSVYNSSVSAGDGENEITIAYGINNTVTTGKDNDIISIGGNATSQSSNYNEINAGAGENNITIGGNSTYGNKVTTGDDDDTITLGDGTNSVDEKDWNVINAGKGHNVITGGSGAFDITVGDSTAEDNKGSEITLGKEGYSNNYTNITAGSGDDTLVVEGSVSGNSESNNTINLGDGKNDLTFNNNVNYTDISTGSGDDTLIVKGNVSGNSENHNKINLGEGKNNLTFKDDVYYTDIATGSGDDTLIIEDSCYGSVENKNIINLGSGKNEITTSHITEASITTTGSETQKITIGSMGEYVDISTGTGDDEIKVSSYGHNSSIITAGGDNKIIYGDNMDGFGGGNPSEGNNHGYIKTGAGKDEITVGTFDEDGNTKGGVHGTVIDAGDGENTIKVAGSYTKITTGKDKDIITIGAGSRYNIINAGDGDNVISIAKSSTSEGGDEITTGEGNDTITIGDINYYNNRTTIRAGAGKNEITVGSTYYGVNIETTGNEKQIITVGKDEGYSRETTITTGTGDDEITLKGYSYGSKITSEGGNNIIKLTGNSSNSVTITTGSGNDDIDIGTNQDSKIYAGAGNNKIVSKGNSNTIETGAGDDNITIGDDDAAGSYSYNTINIGHAERDVFDHYDEQTGDEVTRHEEAVEGGANNTVTLKNTRYNEITIYNTKIEKDKYNTINIEGDSEYSYNNTINVTGGHTHIDLNHTKNNTVTTGSGGDVINNIGSYNNINAGSGNNTINLDGDVYSTNIETGSGNDTISVGDDKKEYGYINSTITIGHDERDVYVGWNSELGKYEYRHESAVEGGLENEVNLTNVNGAEVNIYSTKQEDGKYNTINIKNGYGININATGGNTKVNFDLDDMSGSSSKVVTGAGDDEIIGLHSGSIDAGDGNNIIETKKTQKSYYDITTGSGKDDITLYSDATIKTGAGDDTINVKVLSTDEYDGDDDDNRGNYDLTVELGAGNDTLNLDEGFKGRLFMTFRKGDGASNIIKGYTSEVDYFNITIDPQCEYYIRRNSDTRTTMEVVLIYDGKETGDILTVENAFKDQETMEPVTENILFNNFWIGGYNSRYDEEKNEWVNDVWEFHVPTDTSFIINANRNKSGEISGTNDNDVIYGSNSSDTIKPGDGEDIIRPGKGNDVIDLQDCHGTKKIYFNKGEGNITVKNINQAYINLYIENFNPDELTLEKHGLDYHIVRSNGNTLVLENIFKEDGEYNTEHNNGYYGGVYIYDETGKSYNYLRYLSNLIEKPIHVYEDSETHTIVEAYGAKNILEVSYTTQFIKTNGGYDVTINNSSWHEGNQHVQLHMKWSTSDKFSKYVREGDDLVIKTVLDEKYFYTDEESLWADWNTKSTTITGFFTQENAINMFIFDEGSITVDRIVSEALTHAVNNTTDEGETLTKPQDDYWWLGNYTYNAGDGNDTIIATGNADVAYGNGGNDDIYMYDNEGNIGYNGLFDGGEGNDTYYVKFAPNGTHTIVAKEGSDTLVFADGKDEESGINFDVTDTNTYSMSADGKDIIITSNDYYIDHKIVIKDALVSNIDLTISDTEASRSLKDMMEDNNIYSSCYKDDPKTLYGTSNNDTLYALEDCESVYGFVGSDKIIAIGDKTVYTLGGGEPGSNGFKDTKIGTIDTVDLYGAHNTVYAQSETNIINSYSEYSAWEDGVLVKNTDDYYVHLDQSTTINDAYGNDSLTIMNTFLTEDGQYMISDTQNLFVMWDFEDGDYYYNNDGWRRDILLFNKENLLKWQAGNDLDNDSSNDPKYIRIKRNEIENITTADGYTITSEQLNELAENIYSWMSGNNTYEKSFESMNGLRDGEHAGEIAALVQYVQDQTATMWTKA